MIEEHFLIKGCKGKSIGIDLRYTLTDKPLIPIIYVHGFKAFKDWGSSNIIAQEFANNGFLYLKFNFSHNGVGKENPLDFVDLDAFGDNNYYLEFLELGLVIDWLFSCNLNINLAKLALIGHSRGGGIALLRTAQDTRINKLITWASVSDYETRFPKDIAVWETEGVSYIYNGRTKQRMPLNFQFYTSYFKHQKTLNIPSQCLQITQKTLVIQGTEDPVVTLSEAHKIHGLVKNSEIQFIENAGHTFGAVHPMVSKILPKQLAQVVKYTIDFLA